MHTPGAWPDTARKMSGAANGIERRRFGRSGMTITRLGLGLAAVGRPGYITLGRAEDLPDRSESALQARSHALLDAASAAGVRYFDVARSYGLAEAFLGRWLASGRAPADATIGSKWGYAYTAAWQVDAPVHEQKEHSRDRLDAQWPETLAALGRAPDLYQIQSATVDTGVLENVAVLTRLAALKADGVAIGLSTSGPTQGAAIRKALAVRADGLTLFDAVQSTWCLLEPSSGDALAEAHSAGLGVIVKEPVANGRLTSRGPDLAPGGALADFAAVAQRHGATPDALAIAAALAQPWADCVLSGAASEGQFAQNLAALTLDDDAVAAAHAVVAPESPDAYWAKRGALGWR